MLLPTPLTFIPKGAHDLIAKLEHLETHLKTFSLSAVDKTQEVKVINRARLRVQFIDQEGRNPRSRRLEPEKQCTLELDGCQPRPDGPPDM